MSMNTITWTPCADFQPWQTWRASDGRFCHMCQWGGVFWLRAQSLGDEEDVEKHFQTQAELERYVYANYPHETPPPEPGHFGDGGTVPNMSRKSFVAAMAMQALIAKSPCRTIGDKEKDKDRYPEGTVLITPSEARAIDRGTAVSAFQFAEAFLEEEANRP